MPIAVFIDSSVYLSFFSVSNDDLEQLSKITSLIKKREISLIIPAHVEREFRRNRDKKLSDALKIFEQHSYTLPIIPRFMQEYEEVRQLRKHLKELDKSRKDAIVRARAEAIKTSTRADNVIHEIFSSAGIHPDNDELFQRAYRRMLLDEPPGKPHSLGDRLNWEHILDCVPYQSDVHIVARDADFQSSLTSDEPLRSLTLEWTSKKSSKLHVHSELKHFLTQRYPDFDFTSGNLTAPREQRTKTNPDLESKYRDLQSLLRKEEAIEKLRNAEYEDEILEDIEILKNMMSILSTKDLKEIINIGITSSAIYDNSYNDSVRDFFEGIIPKVFPVLSRSELDGLKYVLEIEPNLLNYEDEPDPLTPNYAELDLRQLEELADERWSSEPPDERT